MTPPRLILDTNVLLSGLMGRPGTMAHRLYKQFERGEVRLVFSASLLSEIQDVVGYPGILARGMSPGLAFKLARDLYELGEYYPKVERYDWPSLPDRKDWFLLDLLYTSAASALLTQDERLREAGQKLGLPVLNLIEGAERGWF
ncbi:MAG: putative toxin-antitoxin system toxin component, PIN family [Thermaceae bacterium]|nr:putative toxin-antitoxin system toxin component, PIN family [Thermaceae bacterium]